MTISELTNEEKQELSKKYKELNKIIKQKETLDEKMIPLCDKLSELEEEEKKINNEYENIINNKKETFSSKQTLRLSEITDRNVQIGIEKYNIKQKISNISNDFFAIRENSKNVENEIDEIINGKKQGSIFSQHDDVVNLDKKGNIIVVTNNNYNTIKNESNINSKNNTLTKASVDVIEFIVDKFSNVEAVSYSLSKFTSSKINSFLTKISQIKEDIKEGYDEEQRRVDEIISNYVQIKENNKKIEEEADNLELCPSNEVPKKIEDNLYYDKEKDDSIVINSDDESLDETIEKSEESTMNKETKEENEKAYLNILEDNNEEVEIDIKYNDINKQAHTTNDKMPEIVNNFAYQIGKNAGKVINLLKINNQKAKIKQEKKMNLINEKKDALSQYKDKVEKINSAYDDSIKEINDIFGMSA